MKKIGIIGSGFVGEATGKAYALKGFDVVFNDIDPKKLKSLEKKGYVVSENVEGMMDCDCLFIAVPTPSDENGIVLDYVDQVIEGIKDYEGCVIMKSTIIPGTMRKINKRINFPFYFMPEFLEQNNALNNTLHPEMIILGGETDNIPEEVISLLEVFDTKILKLDYETAEMVKYAHNCWLAVNIGYWNNIYDLCEKVGAHKDNVRRGTLMSSYFGRHPWYAGKPYGGGCLPKDVKAIIGMCKEQTVDPALFELITKENDKRKC